MTTQEKIDAVIVLLNEIKQELLGHLATPDAGGSNGPGPGQPGKP